MSLYATRVTREGRVKSEATLDALSYALRTTVSFFPVKTRIRQRDEIWNRVKGPPFVGFWRPKDFEGNLAWLAKYGLVNFPGKAQWVGEEELLRALYLTRDNEGEQAALIIQASIRENCKRRQEAGWIDACLEVEDILRDSGVPLISYHHSTTALGEIAGKKYHLSIQPDRDKRTGKADAVRAIAHRAALDWALTSAGKILVVVEAEDESQ